jgi:hypothetical protein
MTAQQVDIYQDFADFIAGLSPEKLLGYYAPPKMQHRVELLIAKKKDGKITEDETREMEKYLLFEHIVRLAKARALKLISEEQKQ